MFDALPLRRFGPVAAAPYAWPFDVEWRADSTALLLLGFQSETVRCLEAEAVVSNASRLLFAARRAGIAAIFARRGAQTAGRVLARRNALGDRAPQPGTPGWRVVEALAPASEEPIVDHAGDNSFYGSGLAARLRDRGLRNLIFAGLPTEGLVHASMRAANDMGFECLVASDACKGTSAARHEGQLRITTFGNGLFGAVAETAAIVHSLGNAS